MNDAPDFVWLPWSGELKQDIALGKLWIDDRTGYSYSITQVVGEEAFKAELIEVVK